MEYLVKVNAVITIFYLCYKLFLQRDTFFESNRWFLLLGLVSSFIIPFITIPIYIESTQVQIPRFITEATTSEVTATNPFNISDYFIIVYSLGILFFFIRFIIQLASLFSIIKKNKSYKKSHYTYVETNNNTSPFSFFNWIVLNPNHFNKTELNQIITHEKIHVNQKHSIDILISQISCIILWFNPFIWFYNKNLKQNLEFIADFKTQNKFDNKSYQTTLLKTTATFHKIELSNNFYNSLIKKRIIMLHKSKSKKINLLKYALVLPLLVQFLISCNSEEAKEEQSSPWVVGVGVNANEKNGEVPLILLDGKEISNNELEKLDPENIKSINILKDEKAIEKYGDKGKNGVVLINTKWETKFIEGKPMDEVKVIRYEVKHDSITKIRIDPKTEIDLDTDPLIIVDDKEITNKALANMDKSSVESVKILKDEKAPEKYGDKGKTVLL